MIKNLFIFGLLIGAGNPAFAYVQFFYQPQKGQVALTPEYNFVSTSNTFAGISGRLTSEQHQARVTAEYGLLSNLSVGVQAGYSTNSLLDKRNGIRSRSTFDGLAEPSFLTKGFLNISERFKVRFGFNARYSEKGEFDGEGKPKNAMDGRKEVSPYLGFDYEIDKVFLGLKIDRGFVIGDQEIEIGDLQVDIKNPVESTTVAFFAENQTDESFLFGFSASYTFFNEGGVRSMVGGSQALTSLTAVSIYSVMPLTDKLMILPSFSYGADFSESRSGKGIASAGLIDLGLGLRLEI